MQFFVDDNVAELCHVRGPGCLSCGCRQVQRDQLCLHLHRHTDNRLLCLVSTR